MHPVTRVSLHNRYMRNFIQRYTDMALYYKCIFITSS